MRIFLISLLLSLPASADTLRIGVAISLKDAMTEISKSYEAQSKDKLEFIFGSSGQIQAQIRNGADIDIFISAAEKNVDELAKIGLVIPETRRIIVGNSVVLIVPADAKDPPTSFESLTAQSVKKLAIGEPKTVPAGDYAMQVLHSLQIADKLERKIVYGANVRQVLSYVERGEVSAGIVYATDAGEAGDKIKVVATAKSDSHDPVIYPAIVVTLSKKKSAAKNFLDFLSTEKAQAVLTSKGFATEPGAQKKKER